jgi:predicted GIY-YIG superfamily endonuclease
MICAGEDRYALYRFYDARENLLYAGITDDPWRRWREHVLTKPWYPQVKHQAVTWYDTEAEAGRAEKRAIRKERPQFNVAGAVRPTEVRFSVGFLPVILICGAWMFLVPTLAVGAYYERALVPVTVAVAAASPIPMLALLLVAGAPWVYRFGCWLDRNFGQEALQRAAAEEEARYADCIHVSDWFFGPRQTYRAWRVMVASGLNYRQALEMEAGHLELTLGVVPIGGRKTS